MYRIGKTFKFDAAHQLTGLHPDHQCGRLHGHTYQVTLTLRAEANDEHGWVFDYGDMYPFKDYINFTLDHKFLNDVLQFQTTAEQLAEHLYFKATTLLRLPRGVYVDSVTVKETESTFAEFSRP